MFISAPDMKSVPSRDAGFWLIVVGVILEVFGLGLDVILHTLDANLAAREGIFSLNRGHLLFLTGLSLSIFGVIAGFKPFSRMGFWVGAGMLMAAFNVALLARGNRTQYRIVFPTATNPEAIKDVAGFENPGSESNRALLVVKYLML